MKKIIILINFIFLTINLCSQTIDNYTNIDTIIYVSYGDIICLDYLNYQDSVYTFTEPINYNYTNECIEIIINDINQDTFYVSLYGVSQYDENGVEYDIEYNINYYFVFLPCNYSTNYYNYNECYLGDNYENFSDTILIIDTFDCIKNYYITNYHVFEKQYYDTLYCDVNEINLQNNSFIENNIIITEYSNNYCNIFDTIGFKINEIPQYVNYYEICQGDSIIIQVPDNSMVILNNNEHYNTFYLKNNFNEIKTITNNCEYIDTIYINFFNNDDIYNINICINEDFYYVFEDNKYAIINQDIYYDILIENIQNDTIINFILFDGYCYFDKQMEVIVNGENFFKEIDYCFGEIVSLENINNLNNIEPNIYKPYSNEIINVFAKNDDGCILHGQIQFNYNNCDIYVPNIFSPNNDNLNDLWYIQSKRDVLINKVNIYDRWGSLVYNEHNFMTNDMSKGWGALNVKGVFVCVIEYYNLNGQKIVYKTDITVI